jgi:ATP-dependent RNA helicase RhlE
VFFTLTIHGDKEQKERIKALSEFQEGKFNVLIATDITARGIDVKGVDYVINYDLPEDPENYVHRIGRTGRGRDRGEAYSFCSKEELLLLKEIEAFIEHKIDLIKINKGFYEEVIAEAKSDKLNLEALMKEGEKLEEFIQKKKKKKGLKK